MLHFNTHKVTEPHISPTLDTKPHSVQSWVHDQTITWYPSQHQVNISLTWNNSRRAHDQDNMNKCEEQDRKYLCSEIALHRKQMKITNNSKPILNAVITVTRKWTVAYRKLASYVNEVNRQSEQ
ncbi:hypothetical protein chiPu_0012931 [Chiloscyllium punctatum]|uniref:Uncharacterized protein n=1 Tax=Chiloscyllium punctatum TaxID=137246 RepID=A0A401SVM6_CHIPU|nr:hypothetical protein [Chiloscyllium punctatum]